MIGTSCKGQRSMKSAGTPCFVLCPPGNRHPNTLTAHPSTNTLLGNCAMPLPAVTLHASHPAFPGLASHHVQDAHLGCRCCPDHMPQPGSVLGASTFGSSSATAAAFISSNSASTSSPANAIDTSAA